jgi:hypothetical protein
MIKSFTTCFILFLSLEVIGQFGGENFENLPPTDSTSTIQDTSTADNSNSLFDIFTGKPGKAAFYSLIVPGGGQYYNKRYWKIPLVWGIEGSAIAWFIWNNSRLDEWQTAYIGLLNGEIESYMGVTQSSTAKLLRDRYRKNKEYAYIGIILAHLLNVFDAFIDRHLIDFDIDDDLSMNQQPFDRWSIPTYGSISIKIPLNRTKQVKPKNLLGL